MTNEERDMKAMTKPTEQDIEKAYKVCRLYHRKHSGMCGISRAVKKVIFDTRQETLNSPEVQGLVDVLKNRIHITKQNAHKYSPDRSSYCQECKVLFAFETQRKQRAEGGSHATPSKET